MNNLLHKVYRAYYNMPFILLAVVALAATIAALNLQHFSYDASADTLVAENDEELVYFREVSANFEAENFIFITYEPKDTELFAPESLARLAELQAELEAVRGVSAITSILDVPLLRSPPVEFNRLATDYKTLRSPDVDMALAQKEILESPLYQELLISADGRATALRLNLAPDTKLAQLRQERDRLRALEDRSSEQTAQLRSVENAHQAARRAFIADQERIMTEIRQIRDAAAGDATLYFAGVPMVASDMIRFVQGDISTFGGISVLVVMVILFVFLRQMRWVMLPVFTALLAVLITSGLLGFLRQPVTVISANFVALLIIFSISFTIHLIVRYRELVRETNADPSVDILSQTMVDKFAPCLYTALTTMAAFASLMASNIIPVVDLGWVMCMAMATAFFLSYTFFPAVVRLLPRRKTAPLPERKPLFINLLRMGAVNLPRVVLGLAVIAVAASAVGMSRLSTESRFIDYFRDTSDIKQGLVYIDESLGGTTPMDIMLTFAPLEAETLSEDDDFLAEEPDPFPERYWYTPDKIEKLREIHAFLEAQPEVGKIISLATLEEIARDFNNGEALSTVQLAAVVGGLPPDLREEFLRPFSVPEIGLMRLSVRMKETAPRRSRDALIQSIEEFAINEAGFEPDSVRVTGVNVLFNNMLKILFQSQYSTIGLVVLATFIMLLVLLRSLSLAVIGVIPNLLSASMVLGFMGFMGITLDMMTMTIAAIIIGIGVDNAIHYLHRFKDEKAKGRSNREAIEMSHGSIGFALYFTSITVIAGFFVLVLSHFIPTVYFGALTALAMALSLIVNLLVLPSLLMVFVRDNGAVPQAVRS